MIKNLLEKLKKVFTINADNPYYYLGVLVVALLIFGFSFWQAQNNINQPFVIGAARFEDVEGSSNDELDLEDVEALKKVDTDRDGLSDYLELYVYGTSAYIEDTDSDGLSDGVEVVSGANPLCGNLDGCESSVFSSAPSRVAGGIQFDGDEQALRQALTGMGFSASDLSVLSIQDMNELYQQANNVLSGNVEDTSSVIPTYDDLYNLSVEEIRSLLLAGGVTEEELVDISDEKLLELYQEALLNDQ